MPAIKTPPARKAVKKATEMSGLKFKLAHKRADVPILQTCADGVCYELDMSLNDGLNRRDN